MPADKPHVALTPLPRRSGGPTQRKLWGTVARDIELAAVVDQLRPTKTISEIQAELAERFPPGRLPSRSALGRYLKHLPSRERLRSVRAAELREYVAENVEHMTLDELVTAARARFPDVTVPSRSSVGRYVQAVRAVDRHPDVDAFNARHRVAAWERPVLDRFARWLRRRIAVEIGSVGDEGWAGKGGNSGPPAS